ncbi:hypothetical protein PSMK_09380 [Phycisphaera mikurensis NBRC 102666]|uniref:Uncharacterized protein n=1 Tax=Phycisphaera mikurensis (strain NBRC 102666 / KCTC 22515 / FYK2301M01) TaxID=1142394 RepID=I0ICV9_PHYMF|nr:hypothetical protein PSMK_09380 [Phycisphaera mikurensis NBRC 102666]
MAGNRQVAHRLRRCGSFLEPGRPGAATGGGSRFARARFFKPLHPRSG